MHEFLIAHSPRSDVSACSDDGMSQVVLEQPDMLAIATQIAAGEGQTPENVSSYVTYLYILECRKS